MGNIKHKYDDFAMYGGECEVTELLYVYLDNIRCFKDNAFTFTSEYEITYNNPVYNKDDNNEKTRVLNIKPIDSNIPENFFGENISNINLIVGQNGSGKSTLLSLLGDSAKDRHVKQNDYFNEQNNKVGWFSIYKTNTENIFYIEGYNITYLGFNEENSNEIKEYRLFYDSLKNNFYKVNKGNVFPSIICINSNSLNSYTVHKDTHNVFYEYLKSITPNKTLKTIVYNNKSYLNLYEFLCKKIG